MTNTYTATVPVVDGRCQFTEPQRHAIRFFVNRFNGKAVTVTWARPKSVRSLKSNAYLWSAIYPAIAEHTGMTTEDAHEWCKDEFLPRRFVTLGGKEKEIRKSSADLTQKEFGEFIERIIAFAAQELGITIPPPS